MVSTNPVRSRPDLRPSLLLPWAALVLASVAAAPAAADETSWRIHAAESRVDTVRAGVPEALSAARHALEEDGWQVVDDRDSAGRLVTRWKPLKHALVRLALGEARARCLVEITPLRGGRTEIALRGAIATDRDVEGNPVFDLAQATYRRAADRWFERVRELLSRASAPGPQRS